jgi:hypothetical protein
MRGNLSAAVINKKAPEGFPHFQCLLTFTNTKEQQRFGIDRQ